METIWIWNVCVYARESVCGAHVDLDCKIYKYRTLFQPILERSRWYSRFVRSYSLSILHITKTMLEIARIIII